MDQQCELTRQALQKRKCSLLLLVSILTLSALTFLCEQEIFPVVCASSYVDETYEDKVRLKTSDVGIFVGVKERLEIPPPPPLLRTDTFKPTVHVNALRNSEESASRDYHDDSNKSGNSVEMPSKDLLEFEDAGDDGSRSQDSESEDKEVVEEREKTYYVFKGIPYAKPPVGNLRWKDPQILDIKSAAQDNTKYKAVCSQWSKDEKKVVGSQDCLYLNIFTPHLPPALRRPFLPNPYTVQDIFYQKRHLYPVLIYVHGGELISGSGNYYEAKKLLRNEDVVLVTFNYRLGVFGFMSTEDGEIAGNFGLLDQIFAVKWIQKYIQRFGGNPTRMTVFGDVGYLLFSPLAVGLFQGAIWTSSSINLFSSPGNLSILLSPDDLTKEIAVAVRCPTNEDRNVTKETIQCLKLTPVDDLIRAQQSQLKFHNYPRRFFPVVDVSWRDFPVLIDEPRDLVEMGTLVKVPVIAGVNQMEGYDLLLDFTEIIGGYDNLRDVDKVKETLKQNLRFILEGDSDAVYSIMFEAVWKHYFGDAESSGYTRGLVKKLLLLFGDIKSHAGFWTLTRNLTRNVKPPAFAYVFSHKANEFASYFREESNKTVTSAMRNSFPPWQDLHYILSTSTDNETDVGEGDSGSMELIMTQVWTSFAKYGTPKEAVTKFENWTKWRRVERNHNRLYDLSRTPGPMKSSFRSSEAMFWCEKLPEIRSLAAEKEREQQYYTTLFWITVTVTFLVFILVAALVVYCICFR